MGLSVRDMKPNSKPELFKSIEQMQFKQRQNYALHILIPLKASLSEGIVLSRLIDLKFLPA